jgi:Transglycosylase SLT domain
MYIRLVTGFRDKWPAMRPWLGLLLFLPVSAQATPPPASPAQLCEAAISAAEIGARLPAGILAAIAVVESGRADQAAATSRPWPWTINAAGQQLFFATKQEAIETVRTLQVDGVQSIDVGCMQVNLMFHPHAFSSLEEAFDPAANTRYAAKFLNVLYAASHDWQTTIAAYHSETPAIGSEYFQRVMAHWDGPGFAAALAYDANFPPPGPARLAWR